MFRNNDDRIIETDIRMATLESAALENNQDLWSAKVQLEYSPHEDSLVSGFSGNTQISYARPRTYGVTIRRDF